MDTAADQCTCGGPAWIVLEERGKSVIFNGYLKGNNGFYSLSLPNPQLPVLILKDRTISS